MSPTKRGKLAAALLAAGVAGSLFAAPAASAHPSSAPRAAAAVSSPASGHAHHHAPRVVSKALTAGLYQVGYSERHRTLWTTYSVFDTSSSGLVKVDPRTLKASATFPAPVNPATGEGELIFGIAVDDEHDTVWATNTTEDAVSVYSQRTGKQLAYLTGVGHSREIAIDPAHNLAWATGVTDGSITAFDTRTFKQVKRFVVDGAQPSGVTVDPWTGTAYATDLNGSRIIAVSRSSRQPRFIPTGNGPISIALSKDGRLAYTADQADGTASIVDLRRGKVVKTIATGEGSLAIVNDPCSGKVLVANRTAGTVTVIDPRRGVATDTITTAANPNDLTVGGGSVWLVDKSGDGSTVADNIYRISVGTR